MSQRFEGVKIVNRLIGYSNSDRDILSVIDNNYENSKIIKGMKTLKSGAFSSYTKVLSNDDIEKIIQKFEKEISSKYFKKIMREVYEKMVFDYPITEPSLKIRNMTSRWGSCMPSKNQITLNLQLIHYDEKFIEYVVYHEYAHLIQPNHSKAFYRIIEKYMPDYKEVSEKSPKLLDI